MNARRRYFVSRIVMQPTPESPEHDSSRPKRSTVILLVTTLELKYYQDGLATCLGSITVKDKHLCFSCNDSGC